MCFGQEVGTPLDRIDIVLVKQLKGIEGDWE